MKFKSVLTTVLLGSAALLLTNPTANATLVYNTGDLLLGFRAASGTGSDKDYVVNLGNVSNYTGTGAAFTVNAAKLGVANFDLGQDLTNIFDAIWNSRGAGTEVQWSFIGSTYVNGDPNANKILYVSSPELTLGDHTSNALVGRAPVGQGSTISYIQTLASEFSTHGTATANNSVGTTQSTATANSWNSYFQFNSGLDFNAYAQIEGNFSNGTSDAAATLDLFQLNPVNGQQGIYKGSFKINNAGVLTYTPVPEPSTYGLAVVAGLLVIYARRRIAARR